MATTYYHVIDEDNGEHIATYTDHGDAANRMLLEELGGRDFCTITTALPTVTVDSAVA